MCFIVVTWSKTQTSSVAFDGDVQNASKLDTNKVVLTEWVSWLVTRGWVINDSDTTATGSGTIWWKIKKEAVVESGGTNTWGMYIEYTGNASGTDNLKIQPTNNTGSVVYAGEYTNATSFSGFSNVLAGTWTFWQSDQDTDSFFLMNQLTNRIIGFWPPSGSLFGTVGYSGNFPSWIAPKPLYSSYPIYLAGSASRELFIVYSQTSTSTNYYSSPVPLKIDYVYCTDGSGFPFMVVNGGDMSCLAYLNQNGLVAGDVSLASYSKAGVAQIGTEYFVTWGSGSSELLFSTGTTAPVF